MRRHALPLLYLLARGRGLPPGTRAQHVRGTALTALPDTLTVEDIAFALRWSHRRQTIGITIYPDGRVVVAAPAGCSRRALEQTVRGKLCWVRRKLAQRAAAPPRPQRTFMDGEELAYLGRRHRLLLVDDHRPEHGNGNGRPCKACAVRLVRGRLQLPADLAAEARTQLAEWYALQARRRLPSRVAHFAALMNVQPGAVQVKDLGRRWGTCDSAGRVRLHWQIMVFPPEIGDYVVVHELAHLDELNHSGRFWSRVEQVLPDYRQRKAWLKSHAEDYVL